MGEVSYSDHLMCEFHKHLKLHQTECALYCFNLLLNRQGGDDKERSGLFSLLKNIILNPFSSCDVKVGCERLLKFSWHCLQFYPNEGHFEKLKAQLQEEVEFRLLLVQCERILSTDEFLQELYEFYSTKLEQKYASFLPTGDGGTQLSAQCLNNLQTVLQTDPCLGHHLCRLLATPSIAGDLMSLQHRAILDVVSDMMVNESAELERILLQLLLYFASAEGQLSVEQLDVLFQAFQLLHDRDIYLDVLVLAALLPDGPLAPLVGLLEKEAVRLTDKAGAPAFLSAVEESLVGALVTEGAVDFRRALLVLLKRHGASLLTDLPRLCLKMVANDDLEALRRLFERSDVAARLRPLVLVTGWRSCVTVAQLERFFAVCRLEPVELETPLGRQCRRVLSHFAFFKACLDAIGFANYSSQIDLSLLHDLNSFSRLKIIASIASLASIDAEKVLEILNNAFPDEVEQDKYRAAQEVDLQLFNAFRILRIVSDTVVQFAPKTASLTTHGFESLSHFSEHHVTDMQQWYALKVISRLDEAQRLAGALYPLSLRLEVLENVFSLLFVTVNDCLSTRSTTHSGDDNSDDADSSDGSGAGAAKWAAKFRSSSTFSSEGSCRVGRDGFVCPPFLARDLVLWVCAGLDRLQVDDVVLQQAPETTSALDAAFGGGASSCRYRERVAQLSRHLSDAKWRLDLLIGADQLEMTYGRVHALSLLRPARFTRPSSSGKGRSRSQQQQRGTTRGGEDGGGTRRKRSGMEAPRRPPPVSSAGAAKARGVPLDVVAFLLAAPETMVAICLKTGRHERVPEVMKIFNIEGPSMAAESVFQRHFSRLTKELFECDTPANSLSDSGGRSFGQPGLKALAKCSEVEASPQAVIEELLSLDDGARPRIHVASLDAAAVDNGATGVLSEAGVQDAAVLIDLGLHSARQPATLAAILDLARRRLALTVESRDRVAGGGESSSTSPGETSCGRSEPLQVLQRFLDAAHEVAQHGNGGNVGDNAFLDANLDFPSNEEARSRAQALLGAIAAAMQKFEATRKGEVRPGQAAQEQQAAVDQHRAKASIDESAAARGFKKIDSLIRRATANDANSLLKMLSVPGHSHSFGYLSTLLAHIRILLLHLMSSSEEEVREKASRFIPNIFSLLTESPTDVLGDLLFKINTPPALIAELASRLGLNISHVILQNCCPVIPLQKDISEGTNAPYVAHYNPVIYNNRGEVPDGKKDPLDCVTELLSAFLELLKADWLATKAGYNHGAEQKAFLPLRRLRALATTNEVTEFLPRLTDLVAIDFPEGFETAKHQTAFFLNLHNLMVMHWLLEISKEESAESVVQDSFDALIRRRNFCYQIGGLGVVSLFSIREEHLEIPDPTSLILGPYIKPDRDVSFIFFGLVDPTYDSMPIQIYDGDSLIEKLQENLKLHLQKRISSHATISEERKQKKFRSATFELPFAYNIFGRLCLYKYNEFESIKSRKLLSFLERFCPADVKEEIGKIIEGFGDDSNENADLVTLEWAPASAQLGLVINALPPDDEAGLSRNAVEDRPLLYPDPPQHPLSLNALDYLRQANPLLATLSMLICPDKFVDQAQELIIYSQHYAIDDSNEEAPPAAASEPFAVGAAAAPGGLLARSGRKTSTATSVSQDYILDVKSYRYQRLTADFPHLGQYIYRYWIALARGRAHLNQREEFDSILKFCSSTAAEDIRWNLLSHTNSATYKSMLLFNALYLLQKHKYLALVDVVNALPARTLEEMPVLREMKDFALVSQLRRLPQHTSSAELAACLWGIAEPALQARSLLCYLPRLTGLDSLRLLESCLCALDAQPTLEAPGLTPRLQAAADRMRIFQAVTKVAMEQREKEKDFELYTILVGSWCHVERLSCGGPADRERLLDFLLRAKEFQLAQTWADRFDPDARELIEAASLEQRILESYVEDATSLMIDFMNLLDSEGLAFTLCVCRTMVRRSASPLPVLLAAMFALFQLGDHLVADDRKAMIEAYLGGHMLRLMPEGDQEAAAYRALVRQPRLLLEQMLMNMKTEWFSAASDGLREELELLPRIDWPASLTESAINELIMYYAWAAVEVAAVVEESPGELTELEADLTTGRLERSESVGALSQMSGAGSMTSVRGVRRSLSFINESVATAGDADSPWSSDDEGFEMPSVVPAREHWIPDSKATTCMCCRDVRFSMYNRRHHCRRCGRVVCGECSRGRAEVLGTLARVCRQCIDAMGRVQSGGSGRQRMGVGDESRSMMTSMGERRASVMTLPQLVMAVDGRSEFRLTEYGEANGENEHVRQDFFYEQAPSIHLCLAILDLHTDSESCGRGILTMCERLSTYLKSNASGQPNPEVDYPLVLEIIRSLLVNAKLRFYDAGIDEGVHRCDEYIGVVDLMHLLVHNNYRSKLPSLSQLVRSDRVRILRDRLIMEERLELALQVTLRCGHDPTPVWAAMGLRDLEFGQFESAREHFARCFKSKEKRGAASRKEYLEQILAILDDGYFSGMMLEKLSRVVKSFKNLLDEPEKKCQDTLLKGQLRDECFYYLETYGDHETYLHYMSRHKLWQKAVKYVADRNIAPRIFIDAVVAPALTCDALKTVRQQMVMVDTTLRGWDVHLKELCQYLVSANQSRELYETQLFMGDFYRAAAYCVRQFTAGARTYAEHHARLAYLTDAQNHLRKVKEMAQSRDPLPGCVIPLPRELEKFDQRIQLQTRVTAFLMEPMVQRHQSIYAPDSAFTVFDSVARRVQLCLVLLFSTNVLGDGLRMAARVVQETNMNAVEVLVAAGRFLMSVDKLTLTIELLNEMREVLRVSDDGVDDVIIGIMEGITEKQKSAPEINRLLKRVTSQGKKVRALIALNQLRAAYLLALRTSDESLLRMVYDRASAANDSEVKDLCIQYFNKHKS